MEDFHWGNGQQFVVSEIHEVSSAYAEDFHWGIDYHAAADTVNGVSSAYAEDFHWGEDTPALTCVTIQVTSAYAEDFHWGGEHSRVYGEFCCFLHCYGGFHWGQGKCEFIPSFGFLLLI